MPVSLGREIGVTLRDWVRGEAIVIAVTAAIYALGFAVLRVPLWPLVAIFCALMHLVPVVGAILALVVPIGGVLLGGGNEWSALGVIAVYVVAQGLEGFVLTPRIVGRKVRLHPAAVFLAVLFGGMLFGFVGVMLAVPVLAVLAVIWRRYRKPAGLRPPG